MSLFNFSTPQQQPAQPQTSGFNFNLGQPATSQPSFGSFGQTSGLNTFQQNSNPLNQSFSLTSAPVVPQSAPAPLSIGLGGEGASSQATTTDSKLPKDSQTLPPEISSLVESLKTFVAAQKSLCDKNSLPKYSVQPILDINSELDENFKTALQRLDVTLERNKTAVEFLKKDTNVLVSDAENAFRSIKSLGISANSASYPFVQSPTTSPARTSTYFDRLVIQFDQQMDIYSKQIRELEVHLANMNKPPLPQEVILIVKKQHETLVALAAEIYALHEHISALDSKQSNRHSSAREPSSGGTRPKTFVGPNPFALGYSSSPNVPSTHSTDNPISSVSSLFPANSSLSNFSFSSPTNVASPNRAKRFTAG